jgi:hypothetical protein
MMFSTFGVLALRAKLAWSLLYALPRTLADDTVHLPTAGITPHEPTSGR